MAEKTTATVIAVMLSITVIVLSGCIESGSSPEPETRYVYLEATPTPVQTPIPTSQPRHCIPFDERDDPMYVNYNDDIQDDINEVCSEFAEYMPIYIRGEVDCSDMAVYLWNKLQESGVKTLLVAGTTDGEFTPFDECDHVWLSCRTPTGSITIEPTMPAVIYSNKYITFRTEEEVEELLTDSLDRAYKESRIKSPGFTDEGFDDHWEECMDTEDMRELKRSLEENFRYQSNEKPDDFPDYSYGFHYAKPSDLRADVGDRW